MTLVPSEKFYYCQMHAKHEVLQYILNSPWIMLKVRVVQLQSNGLTGQNLAAFEHVYDSGGRIEGTGVNITLSVLKLQ